MSNTTENTLRNKYFANEIFRIGELVEDTTTNEKMKIIDRGSNYVTVATSVGVVKKWLNEVREETKVEPVIEQVVATTNKNINFTLLEDGQIKMFGYETKNFDLDLSEFVLEQFSEFEDLYSQHQIVKCIDLAIQENDQEQAYSLLDKVENFYSKQELSSPPIVEAMKTDLERKRIAEIIAAVAGIDASASNAKTIRDSIAALKEKYNSKKQWEVLFPFFVLAQDAGLTGAAHNLPFSVGRLETTDENELTVEELMLLDVIEENTSLLVEDFEYDDIEQTFLEEEFSEELLFEVLSIEARNKLSRKLKQRETVLGVKRERALTHSASSEVLLQRARRLAETMLKRRMFRKPVGELSRQEKERFEAGASKRKAMVARLAQKLVSTVRRVQASRMHHTAHSTIVSSSGAS